MRHVLLSVCLLLLAPIAQAANIAGLWVGYYAYDPGVNPERVECAMALAQVDGEIGGSMIERQTFGENLQPGMPSAVGGELQGNTVTFNKYYYSDDDSATIITYTLQLSPDGNTMNGFWRVGDMSGTALFRRVTAGSVDRIPAPR